jgi:hypothetical protein
MNRVPFTTSPPYVWRNNPDTPTTPPDPNEETIYVQFFNYFTLSYTYFTMLGSVESGLFEGNGHSIVWSPEGFPDEWIFLFSDPSYGTGRAQEVTLPHAQSEFSLWFSNDRSLFGPYEADCRFIPWE